MNYQESLDWIHSKLKFGIKPGVSRVEWLLNDDVVVLAESSPEKLTDAVCTLLQDNERRHALSQRAEAFARSQTWEAVARDFEAGLQIARAQNPQGGF